MRVFRRLPKLVWLLPDLLRLFANAIEAYEDRRLTDAEKTKLWEEFMVLVKKASKTVIE